MVAALLRRATFNIGASVSCYPGPSYMERWHIARDSLPTAVQGVFRIILLVNPEHILNLHVHTGSGPPSFRYLKTNVTVSAILPEHVSNTDDLRR